MSVHSVDAKNTLRDARQTLGLTYEAFAVALGINMSTLSRYETSKLPMPRTVDLAVRGLLATPRG